MTDLMFRLLGDSSGAEGALAALSVGSAIFISVSQSLAPSIR